MPLLYSFLAAKYRTADIVITFSTRMNGGIKVNDLSLYHWCMFLGGKGNIF
jgi:hypothetical protein